MPSFIDARREAGRAFFEFLERQLSTDEVLSDKHCLRLIVDQARAEHAAKSRKRFDPEDTFRHRLLYSRIDDAIAAWCRKRDIRTEPFNVFRYEGPERGPTQHETAIGPSMAYVHRAFERLAERVSEIPDCSAQVVKAPTKVITPAFRLQHPLPFGAAGDAKFNGARKDLERGIYQVAMYVASGGDPARHWRYDCGLFVFSGMARPRTVLGDDFLDAWPEVRTRVWEAGRVWVIVL